MNFKENLQKIRIQRQITQKELAEKIGKGISTLQHYEHGFREPDFKTLEKIKNVLNCTYDDLLN